jgi:hypothetical protein
LFIEQSEEDCWNAWFYTQWVIVLMDVIFVTPASDLSRFAAPDLWKNERNHSKNKRRSWDADHERRLRLRG